MDEKSGDPPVKQGASKRRDKGKKGERGGIGREATLGAHCVRFWWLQLIVITVIPLTFLLPLYVFLSRILHLSIVNYQLRFKLIAKMLAYTLVIPTCHSNI